MSRLEEPVAAVLPLPVWEEIATVAEWHHRAVATWDPAIILALPHAAVARTAAAVHAVAVRTAAAAAIPVAAVAMAVRQAVADDVANEHLS